MITKLFKIIFKKEYWHVQATPNLLEFDLSKDSLKDFGKTIEKIEVPDNLLNQFISMLLSSLECFRLVFTRFKLDQRLMRKIHHEEHVWTEKNPHFKSRKVHPDEKYTNAALRVDSESLYIFGIIIVRRTLPIIKIYLPDEVSDKSFYDLDKFYKWIHGDSVSELAKKMREDMKSEFRWLHATLRFFRNKFIEHLDEPKQTGMNFFIGGKKFATHSYKWGFSAEDEQKIASFKEKMEANGCLLPKENSPRHYIQLVFENLDLVPNEDLYYEACDLINDIGIDSLEPDLVFKKIDQYISSLFIFLKENISESRLSTFPVKK